MIGDGRTRERFFRSERRCGTLQSPAGNRAIPVAPWLAHYPPCHRKDTRGQFTLAEVISRPGTEPPPHLHRNEDETFFVVEGEMSFAVADRTFKATAGTSVFLPRGVPHSFKIESDQVRALCLLVPAGLEGFFEELSQPAETLTIPPRPAQLDMEKILSVSTRHGIEYVDVQEAPSAPVHTSL